MDKPEREPAEAEGPPGAEVDDDKLAELQRALAELPGVRCRRGEPLSRHNALRVGGPADLWCVVDEPATLPAVWAAASKASVPCSIDYPLSDRLIKAGGIGGLVIRPGQGFEQVSVLEGEDGPRLELGACAPFARASVTSSAVTGFSVIGKMPNKSARWPSIARSPDTIQKKRSSPHM
jgi:hypothetical protein